MAAALVGGTGGCAQTNSLLGEMARITPAPQSAELTWEVQNRHRLLAGQEEQDRFEQDLAAFIEEYRHWYRDEETVGPFPNIRNTDLLHPRSKGEIARNYRVNYDPGTNSYRCQGDAASPTCGSERGDWIEDPARTVTLNFGQGSCTWTIKGVDQVAPCVDWTIPVLVDDEYPVQVIRQADGARDGTTIQVRDTLILALGDSFSAGEGNPHRQWRFENGLPALWLDARCHRSLMSAPALTAAYLARSNPHASVTLVHYGCSGASVADGLVTPWSQLETTADIREQYSHFGIEGEAFARLRVVTTDPQLHDVPLSQLRQAQADLTVDGRLRQPDIILISIGGNDIGFASIVGGLAAAGDTAIDLRADVGEGRLEQVIDRRAYANFDQNSWVQAARNVPCFGVERVQCMANRIEDRMYGPSPTPGRATLQSQYDTLSQALVPLAGSDSGRVLITHYPNFMTREADGVPVGQALPEQAVGCHDRPLDGRPGFVPGVIAWWPGLGMEEQASGRAQSLFLAPLNGAVSAAADRHNWTVVSGHVRNGRTHGYCSFHRYYNTMLDSYWDQGRRYDTRRPMGNIVIQRPDNLFHQPAGTRIIWDAAKTCFVLYPVEGECLPNPQTMPVYELRRQFAEGATDEEMVAEPSTLGTTGPVHPNLFGHCNYASAILTTLVRNRPDVPYATALVQDVAASGADGLKAEYLCDSRRWGFVHNASHEGW
ncbi:SGNH/GDSL hydrolase family protein [Brevundimonas sp. TWP2-3-2]|uniref:SGNH/GDSL hydrolase family protein n=1 Tax=unclassified Brevundimonas TaxID=2622653 RepID=UPI003CEAEB78